MYFVRWSTLHWGLLLLIGGWLEPGAAKAWMVAGAAPDAPMCAFEVPASISAPARPIAGEAEAMCAPVRGSYRSPSSTDGISIEDARSAFSEVQRLAEEGRPAEALLHLRVVERRFPSIRDRLALLRGELLVAAGDLNEACESFASAESSPDSTTRARASIAYVRCLIRTNHPGAERELVALERRFPELSEAVRLWFELAEAMERAGDVRGAMSKYFHIDLMHPGTEAAEDTAARLDALRATGATVPTRSALQEVERAERLARNGPRPLANRVLRQLLAREDLSRELRMRTASAAAFVAVREGRLEDLRDLQHVARFGTPEPEVERTTPEDERRATEARIQAMTGGRPLRTQPPARLALIVRLAAAAKMTETVESALDALQARRAPPGVLFDAAVLASSAGADQRAEAALATLTGHPTFGAPARYHRGRALERLGRVPEAEAEYHKVRDHDRSENRYYTMWASQRLGAIRDAVAAKCGPQPPRRDDTDAPLSTACFVPTTSPQLASAGLDGLTATELARYASVGPVLAVSAGLPGRREGMRPIPFGPPPSPPSPDIEALVAKIAPVAEAWGESFPWLVRAADLLRLGDLDAAGDEIHEAYLAWRDARGRAVTRVGLEAVYRGQARTRRAIDWKARAQRQRLDLASRNALAEVARALGDVGTTIGLTGWSAADERPRPFAHLVERAARRHGLDPNLLFAVMRVESVYQPRIVSHAGAVGLMQIMPRTGRLIAYQLGRKDFSTSDLLDPETNLEFAAWYLASLIERFDGRLPLAIASYNGGPHNVRKWIAEHADGTPLDVLLERIPFWETHRYVRRVLTHYAAYRSQMGLPMERLNTTLPELRVDKIGF